ncbi:MAG: pilus assembly protein [Rhodanobacteraceae bacterium]
MSIGSFKIRRPGTKQFLLAGVWMALVAPLVVTLVARATLTSATTEANYNLFPVQNVSIQQPLAMLLLSRDDKLFFRAFSDYSDLDGDGVLNTTYTDTFNYAGYFDPKLCYSYNSGQFIAAAQGAGINGHTCSSQWSGNFLNWVTMSRIDEERYVLYGGRRAVDTGDTTVLQRAYIPNDGHAWVKIYTDNGSFTPNSGTYSYCNATIGAAGTTSQTDSTSPPLMRVASGTWASWAASNYTQCQWSGDTVNANDPSKGTEFPSSSTDYVVKVQVCSTTAPVMESFCKSHIDNSGVTHYKPEGLLQQFATAIRFGLMTGSWRNPRAGGVLRRNIGLIEGNGDGTCADARNEIDQKTGQFCYIENSTPAMAGIVSTLDNFRVYGWAPTGNNDQTYSDCSSFGTQNRQANSTAQSVPYLKDPGLVSGSNAQACSEWGNPLAGMYAEALRYIQHFNGTSVLAPTSTFTSGLTLGGGDTSSGAALTGGSGDSGDLVPNLPAPKWLDPYTETAGDGGANACSQCNIIVLSTGEPSFDGNSPEVPTVPALPQQAYDATNTVGFNELGTGGASTRQYLFGRMLSSSTDGTVGTVFSSGTDSSTDECVQDTVTYLGLVRGICPETPSTEGSFYLSGLAYGAWTHDMRPDLNKDGKSPHYVKTYTIQLSEPLPSFDVYTNDGLNKITVIPNCTISSSGTATTTSRRCGFMNLKVGAITNPNTNITYGLTPSKDSSGNPYGSFTVYWSDSPYGSHYGIAAVQVLTYCVGSACTLSNVQAYMCKAQNSGDPVTMPSGGSNICSGGQIKQNLSQLSGQVLVRTETVYHANQYSMALGYTELGKSNTQIKNQLVAGVTGSSVGTFLLGTTGDTGTSTNSVTTYDWSTPQIQKFPVGPAQQILLPNPLFLAAKYGGFSYATGASNPMPSQGDASDWDAKNNSTGKPGQDGLPDNYFYVSDPNQLQTALASQLNDIVLRAGSGTAAAVVANHVNGIGVAYRSTYLPVITSSQDATQSVSWAGTLDTLWVDSYGLLRENGKAGAPTDCSSGCQLSSDYTVDPIVVFTTDATDNHPEFEECVPNGSSTFDPSTFSPTNSNVTCTLHQLSDLATIWNAESQLWSSPTSTFGSGLASQRSYTSNASSGRYIFTDIYNSSTNKFQQTDFVWSGSSTCTTGFCGSNSSGTVTGNFGYLNTDGSSSEAQNIVNWVRGVEVSGMRSRTITTDCAALDVPGCPTTATSLTMRLGDIVDSTPLVITSPSENYDLIYGDTSYAKFRAKYSDRRQMVYVGANDGMLHAFNGGFFDASKHALYLQPNNSCTSSGCSANSAITAHPLGGELWAYVPGSLLPHLRWLTDPAYQAGTATHPGQHVFYVDGSPVATDAKIFADDATHPGGWGTILVVPFRLGGGDIKVPVPIDPSKSYKPGSCTSTNNCKYQESFSSYVVLDVTDPEQAPTVLAELSPASTSADSTTTGLGVQSYTTSEPAFAVEGEGTSSPRFFMFIGSGPTQAAPQGTAVTSTQPLRVYAYDLACFAGTGTGCPTNPSTPLTLGVNSDGSNKTTFDLSNGGADAHGKNSFAGDLIASDFNLDGNAEAVYFGSVRDDRTDSPRNYSGSLWKISLNGSSDPTQWSAQLMYDPQAPITARPTLGLNSRGAPMVYGGTGRVLDGSDLETNGQQYIFGMIDPYLLPSGDPQSDFATSPAPSPMIAASNLLDITNIGVCVQVVAGSCSTQGALVNSQSGSTTPSGASTVPSDVTNFTELQALFSCPQTPPATGSTCGSDAGKAGFVYDLSAPTGKPSERVISAQALLGGVLVTNTYTPDISSCVALGTGQEYAQDFETGTANPAATMLGVNANGTGITSVSLGPGLPSAPSLHAGAGSQSNSKAVTACTQTSTGAIICQKVASIYPVTSGEVSWREPLDQ